jgi:hypothetical protein
LCTNREEHGGQGQHTLHMATVFRSTSGCNLRSRLVV